MGRTFLDTFAALAEGLGSIMSGGKAASQVGLLSQDQVETAYRTNWIAQKGIDIPAFDMTREWRTWQADKDQITLIEAEEKRLGLRQKMLKVTTWARLYGGAALILDDGKALSSPLAVRGNQGLRQVMVVSRYRLKPQDNQWDPTKAGFDEPISWQLTTPAAGNVVIHPSRVLPYIGHAIPDTEGGNMERVWGDSVLQAMAEAINDAVRACGSLADLIAEGRIDVIKSPGLMANVATSEYRTAFIKRWDLVETVKENNGVMVIDDTESYERKTVNLAGAAESTNTIMGFVSAAWDIPATRFLAQAPKGLNATGDGDLRNYYDSIKSKREVDTGPQQLRLDDALIISSLGAPGEGTFCTWNPLWQLTGKELAEVEKLRAERDQIYINANVLPEAAIQQAVANALIENGTYPGLEQLIADAEAGVIDPFETTATEPGIDPETGLPIEPDPITGAGGGKPGAKGAKPDAGNDNHEVSVSGPGGLTIKAKVKRSSARDMADATPRPLYVQRKVLNADQLIRWATSQGFTDLEAADDLHVTVAFSRTPLDWMKVGTDWSGDEKGHLLVPAGGPRMVEDLGSEGAVVLLFANDSLAWRHQRIIDAGGSWDFESYQPHITLTYAKGAVDLSKVEAFQGPIRLGPEIFAALNLEN